MKVSFKLGKIAGIGVFIQWTFSILTIYIFISNYRQGYNMQQILWPLYFVLSKFIIVQSNRSIAVPVKENNQIIGAIDTKNILEFIMVRNTQAKRIKNNQYQIHSQNG